MESKIKPEFVEGLKKYPGFKYRLNLTNIFLIFYKILRLNIISISTFVRISHSLRRKTPVKILLVAVILSVSVAQLSAVPCCYADTGIDKVLSDIEQHMSNIKTVQTLFIEKKHMSMFDMPVIIKGKIYIENPDKFSWIVTSPVEYTLIINKDTIIKRDKINGTKSLSMKKNPMFKAVVEQITFWFSGAYASCKKDYDIKLIKKEPAIIKFIPKKNNPASKMLDSITLFFQTDKKYISEIRLVEKNTDSTELFFKDVRINSKIDKSVWKINE